MKVLKPRKRIVYFRLSDEEFEQLSCLCEKQGARSMSDLARAAVQDLIRREAKSEANSLEWEVVRRLNHLDQTLGLLAQRLNGTLPLAAPAGSEGKREKALDEQG
jgi:hypothetical protein